MQQILSYMRKAINDYDMIQERGQDCCCVVRRKRFDSYAYGV